MTKPRSPTRRRNISTRWREENRNHGLFLFNRRKVGFTDLPLCFVDSKGEKGTYKVLPVGFQGFPTLVLLPNLSVHTIGDLSHTFNLFFWTLSLSSTLNLNKIRISSSYINILFWSHSVDTNRWVCLRSVKLLNRRISNHREGVNNLHKISIYLRIIEVWFP